MAERTADEAAVAELKALVKLPGALRVITSEHLCGGPERIAKPGDPPGSGYTPQTDEELEACGAFAYPLTDPRHFAVHDVVDIVGPNHKGQYRALTAEGDWCEGQPAALLKRLRQARGE